METQSSLKLTGPNDQGVAIITIDVPDKKVNTLNMDLMPEFEAIFASLQNTPNAKAVVICSGKPNTFIAGADIDVLDTIQSAEEGAALATQGQQAMDNIANSPIPAVAAIHGDCLGGGLELALACKGRVVSASHKTKLALPEVMLGLLPGAGGTLRLPKLVGLANSLDMMLTGRNIRPSKALRMGLVHKVVPKSQLLNAACQLAADLAAGKPLPRRRIKFSQRIMNALLEGNPLGRALVFRMARKTVMSQTKGVYPAPLKILDVVKNGRPSYSAQGFGELLISMESKGLRHLFHCITALKKDNGPNTEGLEIPPTTHVGMIGAGLMGAGIATVLADKGVTVRLKDRNYEAITKAHDYAHKVFNKARKRRRYRSEGYGERMERLSGGIDYAGFGQADIVIEAVFEDLALKQGMLADIEAAAKKETIFATNTSSLPISDIAKNAAHPERVIGMHFFSPVEKMPLVEIIVTDQTAPEVTAKTAKLARRMGKHVIVVKDCAGFYTTRALAPYMVESLVLIQEGVPLDVIDDAAMAAGFPVGPITLMDEVGIDVGAKVLKTMKAHYGHRMVFPESDVVAQFIEEGRLGRKAEKGFFLYEKGKTKTKRGQKLIDPSVKRFLPSPQTGVLDHTAIGERLILSLVNEAAWCLKDGILREPMAGDLGAIMGIGFPPFEGGPFRYCDRHGLQTIVAKLKALEAVHGARFSPSPILIEMAEAQATFYS